MNLNTYAKNTWCPGCGNFGILAAFKQVIVELSDIIKKEQFVVLTGIGCHGKIYDYVNLNGFYCLHGRAIPVATGIKMANTSLYPIVFSGDGDVYGEGFSHVVFAAKRNSDITLIVHNNLVYGLTTGQFTPTSPKGYRGKSTPKGSIEEPINPLQILLVSNATFVGRTFSGDVKHMKEIIKSAIVHKGFSIVEILQPCISFFDTTNFYRKHIYKVENKDNLERAIKIAGEWKYNLNEDAKIPIGIFFEIERDVFEEQIRNGRNINNLYVDIEKHLIEMHS